MSVVRREKQKEWLMPVRFHELDGLINPLIRQVLITKPRRVASCIEANSTYPIVNRCMMTMRPIHLQGTAMREPRRMLGIGLGVTHPQRILRIEIRNPMIVNVNLRHSVVRRGQ